MRQHRARNGLTLDASASGVQVLDDMVEAGHTPHEIYRCIAERRIVVVEPFLSHCLIAADDCVKRAIEADEERAQLE